jgi:poly(A) polymerase
VTLNFHKAEWLKRSEVQAIFAVLDGDKGSTRAVGGAVRDAVMGRRHSGDIDMATELLPAEVVARATAAGIANYPTGIDHGTITLKQGDVTVEVTTLRKDVQTDGRHAVVSFGTNWTDDARRRDFTLNALYCSSDGTIYDPLGGIDDAREGNVRFIGNAEQRIAEDGLRVYRFFRLSASHGGQQFDGEGLRACQNAADKLDHLSRERVGGEMLRMLGLPLVAGTLLVMNSVGVLQLEAGNIGKLVAYENMGGQKPATRLALMGKDDLQNLQREWRLPNSLIEEARAVLRAGTLIAEDKISEAAYREQELAVEGLAFAAADGRWEQERVAEAARMLASIVVTPFPISGKDLTELGLQQGPVVGQELARLERLWIDSGFALSKADLLGRVSFRD